MVKILGDNMNFDKIFNIATTAMRINRSHPFIPRNRTWRIHFIFIMSLTAACFLLLLNSVLLHDIQNAKFADASKNSIMAIVAFTITYKYWIILHFQESVTDLIQIVDEDYELAKDFSVDEQRLVLQYSIKGAKVCQFWAVSACSTSAVFPLKAFFLMAKSYFDGEFQLVPLFDFTYPWIFEELKYVPCVFALQFCLALFFDFYAMSMYVGFDPMVPIFMLHLCGQIEILSLRISKVFANTDVSDEDRRYELKKIILRLQEIYRFVEVIKTNFTVLYEFIMKTTTFLLPLTAFQITESLRQGEINIEFIGFFTGVILHFFTPCYYSDLLMETGEKFLQAIYSCGWEKHSDQRVKRTILFMMTRATKPLVISTLFYAICLDTFAKMGRDAYSIFNFMNTAWT